MSTNEELRPRQQRTITYLLECPTIEGARKRADVSRSTLYRWMKEPAFQEALEQSKRTQFQASLGQLQSLVPGAIRGLKKLLRSSNESVRLRACVEVLKATSAYGAKAPLTLNLKDWTENKTLTRKGENILKIVEGVVNRELPVKDVEKAFDLLDKLESVETYEASKPLTREEMTFLREYLEATMDVRKRYAGKLSEPIAGRYGMPSKESVKGMWRAREEGIAN